MYVNVHWTHKMWNLCHRWDTDTAFNGPLDRSRWHHFITAKNVVGIIKSMKELKWPYLTNYLDIS